MQINTRLYARNLHTVQAGVYLQVASDAHPEISAENASRRFISIFTVDFYFSTSQLYEFCVAVANLQTVLKPSKMQSFSSLKKKVWPGSFEVSHPYAQTSLRRDGRGGG